jgi:hypothetical protein
MASLTTSFSSRIEEQKPAALTYQTAGEEREKFHIDVATGAYFRPDETSPHYGLALEWHRTGRAEREKNKLLGAALLDWTYDRTGRLRQLVRARGAITRDLHENQTSSLASAFVSWFTSDDPGEGSSIQWNGMYKGAWYPYLGVEYLNNQKIENTVTNATFLTAMVEIKLYPLNSDRRAVDSRLELVGSYAGRRRTSSEPFARRTFHLVKTEANVYVDAAHRIAVGFEYQNGADADSDFEAGHIGIVALKFKL